MPAWLKDKRTILLTTLAVVWTLCVFDWLGSGMLRFVRVERFAEWIHGVAFGLTVAVSLVIWSNAWVEYKARRVRFYLISSIIYFPCWQFDVFLADLFAWDTVRVSMAQLGTAVTYLGGLCWVVWGLEQGARHFCDCRLAGEDTGEFVPATLHPLDPEARYYGKQKRLNQSLSAFCSYSVLFILAFYFMSNVGGCSEVFDLPAGGGEQQPIAQQIKIQKIIRKKFVVNPFSAILFEVPPLDEIKLQLEEITKHAYTVGYGKGQGAGYGGKRNVKIRFIRLKYSGGDWNQGYGPGDDENLLIEAPSYMPGHKFEKKTESRTVAQLKRFDRIAAPPMVYMTGQKNITLSTSETRILREYLLEKHGMIFADNGGSRGWHNQFFAMMNKVLPNVRPVPISLDDPIHRIPVPLGFFPYVVPHGGDRPMGWKVDGRWVCYYHPGDIGDAWANGHAGIDAEIWQACYALGANVINYAYNEHAMWREAQREKQ
jgi:hypothetical protein